MAGKNRTPMVPPRQTTFSPHLENLYQAWAESNRAPQTNDYDMRGYFMDIMRGKTANTDKGLADLAKHYPDTYKLPNHPSFSNESKYSTGKDDPYWIENPAPYNPPAWKLQGTDIVEQPMQYAQGGRVNFDTGGLNYPNYNITTPPVNVTAAMPTDEEKAAYFAGHDENGNLIIPNEFAPPNIPHDTVKATPPRAYNLPNEYSIPRLASAPIETVMALGSGILALPTSIASALDELKFKPSKADIDRAGKRFGETMGRFTYAPRTVPGQRLTESVADVLEGLPPIIPELAGFQGMRRLTPTDVQVMHGRGKLLAEDVSNVKADFQNAQSGITRDRPTLGAALQRKAQSLGDLLEERKSKSSILPNVVETGKSYAIFPEGAPKRMVSKPVDLEGRAHSDEDIWPRFRGAHGYGPAHLESQYIEILPDQLGLAQRDVQAAWEEFKKNKAYELYPDAPDRTSAVRAFQLATPTSESRRAIQNQWLDEFSMTNQLGMPTLAELKVNQDKAVKALEQTYPNMVAKYLGQENADPMLLMAAKDLPLTTDKKALIDKYISLRKEQLDEIRAARTAAGLPPEGKMQEKLDGIKADIEGVDQQLAELTATKRGMERQWNRDTQPAPEGYAELTRHETKLTNQKKVLERQAREMETAPAIEAFHDLAVVKSMSPSEMKSRMEYPMTQFHPYLAVKKDPVTGAPMTEEVPIKATIEDIDNQIAETDKEALNDIANRLGIKGKARAAMFADPINNSVLRLDTRDYLEGTGAFEDYGPALYGERPVLVTPESARIVQPRAGFLKASGLEDVMKDYAMDIYLGKTNKSPEQYIMQKAQELKKVRDDKAAAEAKREELTKANYMSYVNAAPAEKIFGNYAAIEFTPAMSPEELGKGLSIDTDVLNHCVGTGGRANNKHFGIWDPATGQKREGVRSPISNEMEDILNNGAHVTSIRDRATGKPVVTVKMVPDGRQFRLGFVSGVDNNAMDYKAAPALRDYLNSRSADISKGGSHLSKNGVYDLKTDDGRYEAATANNVSRKDIEDFVRMNPDTPRFATKDDVKAMKPQSVAVATRPRPTSAESLESLLEARDEAQTEFDMGIDEGAPDHVMLELSQRVEDIDARINAHPDNNPVTDAEITHYIQNMDDIEIAQHLADWAMDEGMAAPDNWATDTFNDMTPEEYQNITSLRETVRAQLENNPEELQNLRELMGDWEPEAPMTVPEPARVALPLDHEIGLNVLREEAPNITREQFDQAGFRMLHRAQENRVPAEIRNEIGNRIREIREAQYSQALPPAEQAHVTQIREMIGNATEAQGLNAIRRYMDDLGAELSIDTLGTLSEELATRQQNLTQQELNNAPAIPVPTEPEGYVTPRINAYLYRLEQDAPRLTEDQFVERANRIFARAQEQNITQDQYNTLSNRMRRMHHNLRVANNVPAPEFGGTNYAQMRTMIENATPETIIDVGRQLSGNQNDYGIVEFGDLTDLWVNRNAQLRNAPAEPDMQLTGLTPPTAMQTRLAEHLAEMQLWTDEGLRRNIRNLTQHHPQTIYADLNEEMTAQALRLMQTELESRGLHMAEGGIVSTGMSYNPAHVAQIANELLGAMNG